VIFATVGTHQDGFPRMLAALEALGDVDLVVQYGHGSPPANARVADAFLPFPAMDANFAAADVVITHAGVGSILLAVRHGHQPIVMPRLHRLREHVDDHQSQLAGQLAALGRVRVVEHGEALAQAVRDAPARRPPEDLPQTGLHRAVGEALREAPTARRRRARPG
jgi:UDP-N-acetylglucosamine transferase subunit ALG13